MNLGISAFAWTRAAADLPSSAFALVRELGSRSLELPMFDPADVPVSALRVALAQSDLACTVCCILPPDVHPLSDDATSRQRGLAHLTRCVETASELGATLIAGPVLAPIGALPGHRPTAQEFNRAVECLQALAPLLHATNMTLAIEPVNRAETWFLRTAAQAVALVDAVAHPCIGVTLDTFHANIEEKDPAASVRSLGPRLRHVHLSENDRGVLGSGHVDFTGLVLALQAIGYQGSFTIEGFGFDPEHPTAPGFLDADPAVSPALFARASVKYLLELLDRNPGC